MPGGRLTERQIHHTERLALPSGGLADIDLPMIPIVRALWELNFTTLGCCQDLGESIEHNGHGSPVLAKDRQRWADFYKGYAWLKLPVRDAGRLVGILGDDPVFGHRMRRWTHPEAWQSVVWLFPTNGGYARSEPTAQLTFPADQVAELAYLLTVLQQERLQV